MENVINDLVGYENLKIVQNSNYFNFSLDSVILPRFCEVKPTVKNILDLCTGNAPIPLILSTMFNAKITGIEIQKEIFDLGEESIRINHLNDKIQLLNIDAKEAEKKFQSDSFDLITCNPPYFKYDENSNICVERIKAIQRHEILINIEDIARISKKLLKNKGSLVLVHRTDRLIEVIEILKKNNLEPKRIRFVYPKKNSNSNLVLIDARKNANAGLKILPNLICHNDDGTYTKEVLEMFERQI